MNKQRREELNDVVFHLDDAIDRLYEIIDDEQDAYDNLSEGLQNTKTGWGMMEAIDQMQGFCGEITKIKDKISDMACNKKK